MADTFWTQATPLLGATDYARAFVPVRIRGAAADGSQDQFAQAPVPSAGADGKSAYQIWLDQGHTGSQADFLASLAGAITSATIISALTFTPYDAANPAGYKDLAGVRNALSGNGGLSYNPAAGVMYLANMASMTFKANLTAGTAAPADMTVAQVRAALAIDQVENKTASQILSAMTSANISAALAGGSLSADINIAVAVGDQRMINFAVAGPSARSVYLYANGSAAGIYDSVAGGVLGYNYADGKLRTLGNEIWHAGNAPAFVKGILGSRQADVRDIGGWDPTGTNDMAAGYQALVNQAATAAVPVVAGGFLAALGSSILLPPGHVFRGVRGGSGFTAPAGQSSTFLIGHTGKGFVTGDIQGQLGPSIRDMATRRIQPAVVSGSAWSPTDHDYDFFFDGVTECDLDRIMLQNATRGITLNGAHNTLRHLWGHCFNMGVRVQWAYDLPRIQDVHLWPFFSQANEVITYTSNNLTAFELDRVDNGFVDRCFSIAHRFGVYIGQYAGDGPTKPAGTTSKLKLTNSDFDVGRTAYYVSPAAAGHTAELYGVTAQGPNTPTGDPLMFVEAPDVRITGSFKGDLAGGNVARMSAASAGSRIACLFQSRAWNATGAGWPALEVTSGGGHIEALPGTYFENGGGAPISAGDVRVW